MSTAGLTAWGKPRGDAPTSRVHASPTSASNGTPKAAAASPTHQAASRHPPPATDPAKAPAKTQINIAALAARNLGGFVPNKIFVGGVPVTCTEEQFRSYFEPYGAISKVELHALRGFGYITYESVDAVDACLEKYQDHYFGKKWVEVKRSIPRELIDSYEREQRRLQAEHGGGPLEVSSSLVAASPSPVAAKGPGLPKAEGAPPPTAHAASTPAAPRAAPWGKSGGPREPPGTVMVSRIAQLKEMGFSEEVAKRVLAECVWDVNTAIDRLLASGEMANGSPSKGASPPSLADPPPGQSWGAPPAAMAPAPVPGRVWPQPSAAPEPRGCWGAGAPSIRSGPAAPKATPPAEAATAPEPPSVGPPPSPAEVAVAEATLGCEEPETETKVEESEQPLAEEVTPSRPAASEPEAMVVAQAAPTSSPEVPAVDEVVEQPAPQQAAVAHEGSEGEVPPEAVAAVEAEVDKSAEVVAGDADGTAASSGVAPRKQIQRVERTWVAEDSSQMSVSEGDFVEVWVDTSTEHGWIHAEKHGGGVQVGWLPACVLQQLPENQKWMRARQQWQAMDASQCSVEEGSAVIVWVNSRTQEGWTYVESPKDGAIRPGWLPAFCLDWPTA